MARQPATVKRDVLELSAKELLILNNALNEACNGLEPWEFSLRMGVERTEAVALLEKIRRLADEANAI